MSALKLQSLLYCYIFLLLPTFTSPYVCHPALGRLPTEPDCLALTDALAYASQLYPSPRRWGRHLVSSGETEELPRWFWIESPRPTTTCAVVVDIGRRDRWVVDTFPMLDVARAASVVYQRCLVGRGQEGLEFVNDDAHAYVKMTRMNGMPWLRQSGDGMRRVKLLDGSFLLEGQPRGMNVSGISRI
ncbi:hypothetical protein G7Y79_00001g000110 [Physcia stellaris]|nr:hypothetical protein G7Y79_00001g000110 [Physcia stellaris]